MASKIKLSNANGKIVTIENNDSNMSDVTLNGASITKKVDTLANMRAMNELPETVWCSGYHSKNDGAFGSHFYRLKGLKTTETDNSGTVIIVSVGGSDYVYELQYDGAVNVKWFGVKTDGVFNSSDAFSLVAAYSSSNPGTSFVLPEGVILLDGKGFEFGDNFHLSGYGCTLKLIPGAYSSNLYFIANRLDINYNASTIRHKNISIKGISIDGNFLNATNIGYSTSGIHIHQADNVYISDVNIKDLVGTSGDLPGIIFRFSSDCEVTNPQIYNTDRQGIIFWESTGSITNGEIRKSRFREPILVSTDPIVNYQKSYCAIENIFLDNSLTTDGTHTLRFSGEADGYISSSIIKGNTSIDGLYITFPSPHSISVYNNKFIECGTGSKIESDSTNKIRFRDNEYIDCIDGCRALAGVGENNISIDGDEYNCTATPLYLGYFNNVSLSNIKVYGGNSNVNISKFKFLSINTMQISNMTASSYSVLINGTDTQERLPSINSICLNNNTSNLLRIEENCNITSSDCSFGGAGIPLLRLGDAYIWRDTTSDLRLSYSEPDKSARNTAGAVIGTQS